VGFESIPISLFDFMAHEYNKYYLDISSEECFPKEILPYMEGWSRPHKGF
jgi:hypothetical protein